MSILIIIKEKRDAEVCEECWETRPDKKHALLWVIYS